MASNLSRFRHWAKRLAEAISVRERTEITVQTDQVLIIRRRPTRAWCAECGRDVDMVGLSQAAALVGGRQPLLLDSAESHGWHVSEDRNGSPLICLESLLNSM